ncbi:TPA: hypothetical protein ACLAVQ_002144, partial [Neisseria meningitidis]
VWIPACAGMTGFKITVLSDGFRDCGVVGAQLNRHSHESGNLESRGFQSFPIDSRRVGGLDSRLRGNDEFRDCGVVGNDGSGISLRPPRACKRQVHQKCRLKVQTASVSGNQKW